MYPLAQSTFKVVFELLPCGLGGGAVSQLIQLNRSMTSLGNFDVIIIFRATVLSFKRECIREGIGSFDRDKPIP